MNQTVAENKKLQSNIVIVRNVNDKLEEKIYLSRKSTEQDKRVIVKFVNQKLSEALRETNFYLSVPFSILEIYMG